MCARLPEGGQHTRVLHKRHQRNFAFAVELLDQLDQRLGAFVVVLDIGGEGAVHLDHAGGHVGKRGERIERTAKVADRKTGFEFFQPLGKVFRGV